MATGFALIVITSLIYTTQSDTSTTEDDYICVWNSLLNGRRLNNGIYRIVDDTQTGVDRQWIMDDFTAPFTTICQSYAKYFWNAKNLNGRWFLGDSTNLGTTTGDCFCSSGSKMDPLTDTCNDNEYYCGEQGILSQVNVIDSNIEIYWGLCPKLSDVCNTLTVSATTGYKECDGTYQAIAAPDSKINQFNIYKNQDATNKENQYLYFDHTDFRWACGEVYRPCSEDYDTALDQDFGNEYDGTLTYKGAETDAGDPDFKTIISIGQSFTVSGWGNLSHPNGVATFTCGGSGGSTPTPITRTTKGTGTGSGSTPIPTTKTPTTAAPTDVYGNTHTGSPTNDVGILDNDYVGTISIAIACVIGMLGIVFNV